MATVKIPTTANDDRNVAAVLRLISQAAMLLPAALRSALGSCDSAGLGLVMGSLINPIVLAFAVGNFCFMEV